jgi:hypothetical protein
VRPQKKLASVCFDSGNHPGFLMMRLWADAIDGNRGSLRTIRETGRWRGVQPTSSLNALPVTSILHQVVHQPLICFLENRCLYYSFN